MELIGRRIAEQLQIAYYDQEIVNELLKRTSYTESYILQLDEKSPLPLLPITIGKTLPFSANDSFQKQLSIYMQESDIIREMAEKSDCVIVGRSSDYILRERNPFRIFVYADIKARMERCRKKGQEESNVGDKALKKQIDAIDKRRAEYYEFYTNQVWGKKENYDLCINTSGKDIKSISLLLADYIK